MSGSYVNIFNNAAGKITLFIPYFTISIGAVGALCNILTFTARQLNRNACAFYLLWCSVFDLITLLYEGFTRLMLDDSSGVVLIQSSIFCKVHTYFVTFIPGVATYCLALSSIDRCLVTSRSVYWRALSHIKVARRILAIVTCLWLFSGIHIMVLYDVQIIQSKNNSTLVACVPLSGFYQIFISIYDLGCLMFIPCLLMITSSILMSLHIKSLRQRIGPMQFQRIVMGRINRHLVAIMFVQAGLTLIFLSFRVVYQVYLLLTNQIQKSTYSLVIESIINEISSVVYSINFSKSFIICTLTSQLFRKIFRTRFNNCYRKARTFTTNIFLQLFP